MQMPSDTDYRYRYYVCHVSRVVDFASLALYTWKFTSIYSEHMYRKTIWLSTPQIQITAKSVIEHFLKKEH